MTKDRLPLGLARHGLVLLTVVPVWLALGSCQKCRDCTLTRTLTIEGVGTETNKEIREYCGSTLKEVEANASYEKDGVHYSWDCTP
ncbi:MAG: hypothetical protein HYZ16_09760 [Bacteroidetes bacterium]|jgi:hypothetical protein|nr:hypothetical protein [Bacteroidota bacterium]